MEEEVVEELSTADLSSGYKVKSLLSVFVLLFGLLTVVSIFVTSSGIFTRILVAVGCFCTSFLIAPIGENPKKVRASRVRRLHRFQNIRVERWKYLPNVEYISVFEQTLSRSDYDSNSITYNTVYEVNLWYDDNKHKAVYTTDDKFVALGAGYYIAKKMEIDCLDSTNGADREWIDLKKPVEDILNRYQ